MILGKCEKGWHRIHILIEPGVREIYQVRL